jgi:SAM domain (Sterile alpha motif)
MAGTSGEASMEIAAWLDGLGLGQYGQAFRDNEIDERVLPSLTETLNYACRLNCASLGFLYLVFLRPRRVPPGWHQSEPGAEVASLREQRTIAE